MARYYNQTAYPRAAALTGAEVAGLIRQNGDDRTWDPALIAAYVEPLNALSYGADPTGASASDAAAAELLAKALSLPRGGALYWPAGRYVFTSTLVLTLALYQHIVFVGDAGGTFFEFPANSDGIDVTLSLIGSGSAIYDAPTVAFKGLVLLTDNQSGTIAGTAISVNAVDAANPHWSPRWWRRAFFSELHFMASNGGGANASTAAWATGISLTGVARPTFSDISFVGGITPSDNTTDQQSTAINFQAGSQYNIAVDFDLIQSRVQNAFLGIKAGTPTTSVAVQGIRINGLTTAGCMHDIDYEAQAGAGLLQLVNCSLSAADWSVKMVGTDPVNDGANGGLEIANTQFILNGVGRTSAGIDVEKARGLLITGCEFVMGGNSCDAILLHNSGTTSPAFTQNVVTGCRFNNAGQPPIHLTGNTDYTFVQGNSVQSGGQNVAAVQDDTGKTHNIVGLNWENGQFRAMSAPTMPGLTITGTSQTMAQSGRVTLHHQSTGGAAVRLTQDGAAAGAANVLNIGPNTKRTFSVKLSGHDVTTPAKGFSWALPVGLLAQDTNAASTAVVIGTPVTAVSGGATVSTVSLTADTTNGGINLSVTPPDTDTWNYDAVIEWMDANATQ